MEEVTQNPMDEANPVSFAVLRIPFFLEPEYSRDETWSETNRKRLERKWGGKEAFDAQKKRHQLKERGREVGIQQFNLDRKASNTLKSHRLVQWVTKNYGCAKSEALYDVLNVEHFVNGKKLNDAKMLLECAKKISDGVIDLEKAEKFLASDEGEKEIVLAKKALDRLGIHSIPNFVIGGKEVLSGAVHWKELVGAFRRIERTGLGAPENAFATILGIPEEIITQTTLDPTKYAATV